MKHHYPNYAAVHFEEFHQRLIDNYDARKDFWMNKAFPKSPKNALNSAFDESMKIFALKQFVDRTEFNSINDLNIANCSGISHYRLNVNDGKPIQFTVEGKTFQTTGQYTEDFFYFDRWLRHLCVAITLRDNAAIQFLCSINKEVFQNVRLANMPIDDVLMDFIQGMFDPEADHRSLILNMMESTGPENYTQMRANYVAQILLPMANLFMMALTNVDEEKYHDVWRNAVSSHQEYWSSDTELAEDYQGWISFPILAASVLMFDKKGYKLPTELSDAEKIYVPEWLVYGDFEPQPSVGVDFYEGEV